MLRSHFVCSFGIRFVKLFRQLLIIFVETCRILYSGAARGAEREGAVGARGRGAARAPRVPRAPRAARRARRPPRALARARRRVVTRPVLTLA